MTKSKNVQITPNNMGRMLLFFMVMLIVVMIFVDTRNIKIHNDVLTVDKVESISRTHSTYYLEWWDTTFKSRVVFQRIEINDSTGKYLPGDTIIIALNPKN